jgi:hypothetical protein
MIQQRLEREMTSHPKRREDRRIVRHKGIMMVEFRRGFCVF